MSKNLLTLQELAGKNLLRNETLADAALKNLPRLFFPQLFKQAYQGIHVKALRTIVSSWPFPRLPLGALKKTTYSETPWQVVLEEIDKLLIQEVRPREYKLEVLDLRSVGQSCLDVWPGPMDDWLPKTASENQGTPGQSMAGEKHPLKVVVNLYLKDTCRGKIFPYLTEWSDKRRGLLKLYCQELQIWSPCHYDYRRLSQMLSFEYVETFGLHSSGKPAFLLKLAPYLGTMRNLRKLTLSCITEDSLISSEKRRRIITKFASQLGNLARLQTLSLEDVCFLEGNLDWILGSVTTSLDGLAVTHCKLSAWEWNHLSEFPCVRQLQELSLGSVRLTDLSPEPLRVLLGNAGPTLQVLDLEDCHMEDDHLYAIMPALRSCSKLTKFSFYGNQISMSAMRDLLQTTARLRHLRMETYPVPQEGYDYNNVPHMDSMRQHCDELLDTLKAIREPVRVFFGTDRCDHCGNRYIYNKTNMCRCRRFY